MHFPTFRSLFQGKAPARCFPSGKLVQICNRGRPSWLLPHALHGCALRRMEFVFASLPEMLSASQAAFVQTLENVCQHSGGR